MKVLILPLCALLLVACVNRPPAVKPGEGRSYVTPGGVEVFHRNACGFFGDQAAYKGTITLYHLAIRVDGRLRDQPTFTLGEARNSSWFVPGQPSRDTELAVLMLGRLALIATDACWHGAHSRGEDRVVAWQLHDKATSALIDWGLRMEAAGSIDALRDMTEKADVENRPLGDRSMGLVQPYCFVGTEETDRCKGAAGSGGERSQDPVRQGETHLG